MIDKLKSYKSNIHISILLAIVFILGFTGTYLTLTLTQKPKAETQILAQEPEPTLEPFDPINTEESFNVVLLGSGGAGHSGGTLTDSIMVVSIDTKSKKAAMISVPRDLWVPGNYKINASVLNVGYENFKGVLQNITGLKVTKYVSIDFSGISKLIDSIGGIEVDVPKTFDDYFYPIKGLENESCGLSPEKIAEVHQKYSGFELEKQFTCRWEHIHFDKGRTKIDGATALKFARSRHGDSDFGRSARQFAILEGVKEKLISTGALDKIDETYGALSRMVKTDLDLKTTVELVKLLGNPQDYKISRIHLTEENVLSAGKSSDGQYILTPRAGINNFSGVKNYISSGSN